ncbi:MAG: UDP-N-acetylglucosamine 2-epimerase (non-hydrolyzing) [Salinivirgaceae bacterium]|nr:UDP-N-acetylglucosamine 2-epimerase (non-hydrolyzing) [Salinivirgaceae bacterium]
MKILTIIGARPQFIKAAAVSHAIGLHNKRGGSRIDELILHTGQHYDHNMSQIFFDDLEIPKPAWLLNCSAMLPEPMSKEIIATVRNEKFDCVLLYGDTYSTLAGALAAENLHIPIAHIEAGLRSFNNAMPEEHNRIETDRRAEWLFCPTTTAVKNLANEGMTRNVHLVGDVMYDAALMFAGIATKKSDILARLNLRHKGFYLATIHRAENTNIKNLTRIFSALSDVATIETPIVLPLHPRTRNVIESDAQLKAKAFGNNAIIIIEPANYLDMIMLEKSACLILTDSGGIQKEAYFHQTPCVTLREETEWVETVSAGWNKIVGTDAEKIKSAINTPFAKQPITDYGTGDSAQKIIEILCNGNY